MADDATALPAWDGLLANFDASAARRHAHTRHICCSYPGSADAEVRTRVNWSGCCWSRQGVRQEVLCLVTLSATMGFRAVFTQPIAPIEWLEATRRCAVDDMIAVDDPVQALTSVIGDDTR